MSNAKKNNASSSKALRAKLQQGLTQRLGKKGLENLEKQSDLENPSQHNTTNNSSNSGSSSSSNTSQVTKIVTALPGINVLADGTELHPNHNSERSKEREEQFMKTLQQATTHEQNITKKIFHPDHGDYIEKGLDAEAQLNEEDQLSILPPPPLSAPDFFNNKLESELAKTFSARALTQENSNSSDLLATDEAQYPIDPSVVDIELEVSEEYLLKIKKLQENSADSSTTTNNEHAATEYFEQQLYSNDNQEDNKRLHSAQPHAHEDEPSEFEPSEFISTQTDSNLSLEHFENPTYKNDDKIDSNNLNSTSFNKDSTIENNKNNGWTMENQSDKKNKKSTLKSPAHHVAQPQQTDPRAHLHISEEEKNKRKDVVSLRSPLERGVAKPAQDPKDIGSDNETNSNSSNSKSYEQEIIKAIKNGNLQWLQDEATLEDKTLSPQRQEIIFMVAVEYVDALEILLKKGFSFAPKGIAVNSALKNNNFPALNILSQFGAQLDSKTLISLAKWQREQNLERFSNTNLNQNDNEQVPPLPDDESIEPQLITTPETLENELNMFINEPSLKTEETIENIAQNDNDTTEQSELLSENNLPISNDTLDDTKNPENDEHNEHNDEPLHNLTDSKNNNSEYNQNKEKTTMATPNQPQQRYVPKTFTPASSQSGSGLTALERAKLKNYEQILAEKQALESKLLELSAYEEAAQSMEQDLISANSEIERLQETENELIKTIDSLNKKISDFSKTSLLLDEQKQQIKQLQTSNENLANLLEEKEQLINDKNDEIQKLQDQIDFLEEQPGALPEATDILVESGLDEQLRSDTFIELVLNSDLQAIENLATNTQITHKQASYALAYSAQTGNIEVAQWLIDNLDADIHCANELPLLRAIENDNYEMIMFLIEKGANIHHADSFALRKAVQKNDMYLMNLLIKKGANIHIQDNRLLKEALEFKSWDCFQALLAYGATFVDDDGDTEEIFEQNEEAQNLISWFQEQQSLLNEMDPVFLKLYLAQK